MNVKSISRTVGLILLITGIFQLFPLLIAVIDHEPRNILAWRLCGCTVSLGFFQPASRVTAMPASTLKP